MPLRRELGAGGGLLVLVPGVGIQPGDFQTRGMIAELERRRWAVTVATVDPGVAAYMDGSVEDRLLHGIEMARQSAGASRVWLAGISLGCQGILRCVRTQPALAEGALLITPYIASTGLIAEVAAAGGLRAWAGLNDGRAEPDRSLLRWLATEPHALPPLLRCSPNLCQRPGSSGWTVSMTGRAGFRSGA